jgi:hypothetical protein
MLKAVSAIHELTTYIVCRRFTDRDAAAGARSAAGGSACATRTSASIHGNAARFGARSCGTAESAHASHSTRPSIARSDESARAASTRSGRAVDDRSGTRERDQREARPDQSTPRTRSA